MFLLDLGENNFEEASAFIKQKFLDQCDTDSEGRPKKEVHIFFVCATDTEDVTSVFASAADAVKKDVMKKEAARRSRMNS